MPLLDDALLAAARVRHGRIISERTRVGMRAARQAGVRLGRPRVLPDDVVARIVAERAEGRTLVAIAEGLTADGVATARGGPVWRPSTVGDVLKSRAADDHNDTSEAHA